MHETHHDEHRSGSAHYISEYTKPIMTSPAVAEDLRFTKAIMKEVTRLCLHNAVQARPLLDVQGSSAILACGASRKQCKAEWGSGHLGGQVLAGRGIGNEEPQAGGDKHQQHDFRYAPYWGPAAKMKVLLAHSLLQQLMLLTQLL